MELLVVGCVHDGDDGFGGNRADQPGKEAGGADAAGEGSQHDGRLPTPVETTAQRPKGSGAWSRPVLAIGWCLSGGAGEALADTRGDRLDRLDEPLGQLGRRRLNLHDDRFDPGRDL